MVQSDLDRNERMTPLGIQIQNKQIYSLQEILVVED